MVRYSPNNPYPAQRQPAVNPWLVRLPILIICGVVLLVASLTALVIAFQMRYSNLMMPGMSGWEFRAAQLENATLAPIPVVVVTAANVLNNGVHSLSDLEILRKPFDLEALLAVVDRYNAVARARP